MHEAWTGCLPWVYLKQGLRCKHLASARWRPGLTVAAVMPQAQQRSSTRDPGETSSVVHAMMGTGGQPAARSSRRMCSVACRGRIGRRGSVLRRDTCAA